MVELHYNQFISSGCSLPRWHRRRVVSVVFGDGAGHDASGENNTRGFVSRQHANFLAENLFTESVFVARDSIRVEDEKSVTQCENFSDTLDLSFRNAYRMTQRSPTRTG